MTAVSPITTALETERLVLRPVTPADADVFLTWRSQPDVVRYMHLPPWTPQTAADKLATWSTAPFAQAGDVLVLAVELPGTGVIGEVLLKWAEGTGQVEVGWALHPDAAGHGYATEAARALLGIAFDTYGFHRAFARVDADNLASSAVCERLGMRLEARLVENDVRPHDGAWSTSLVYALLASER